MTASATSANRSGARVDGTLQHRTALRDEDHNMPIGHTLHAFDQQLGRDRIDEIGEQNDQRAALEPRVELGKAEGEIGLLVMVVELGGRALRGARSSRRRGPAPVLPQAARRSRRVPTRSPPCSETQASTSPALIAWSRRVMPSTGSSIR